tara:strand:- start:55 stop:222 length:168 start_codon:yes stop_codon:yes gene_type:complete
MPGKWDGKSRITTKAYKDNYDKIFGKKVVQEVSVFRTAWEEKEKVEKRKRKRRKK